MRVAGNYILLDPDESWKCERHVLVSDTWEDLVGGVDPKRCTVITIYKESPAEDQAT